MINAEGISAGFITVLENHIGDKLSKDVLVTINREACDVMLANGYGDTPAGPGGLPCIVPGVNYRGSCIFEKNEITLSFRRRRRWIDVSATLSGDR